MGVGVSGRPAAGGARGRGAPRRSPRGDSSLAGWNWQPQWPQLPTVGARGRWVSRTAPRRRAGPRGFGGAWRARPLRPGLKLGGGGGSLSSPGTRSSERQQSERARSWGRPEGAGRGVGPLQVPVSWRSWQRSSNPRDVRAGAFGRGERELGPRPRKRPARAEAAGGPGGREGAGWRRQLWAGPRWVAAARRLGQRLEPGLPVCLSLKAAKSPPDPLPLPALGDG